MAIKKPRPAAATPQPAQRTNNESVRWVVALMLIVLGLYLTVAVISSYFNWQADQSALLLPSADRVAMKVDSGNFCGLNGALLATYLVDRTFGFFGVLIPIMILLIGVRVGRTRPILFNHSILSLFFILILGSLTLGLICGDSWSLCCSTGWGGAYGIEVGRIMLLNMGGVGSGIVLFFAWLLTGAFINRNFINTVNSAGNAMVDRGGKIVDIVKNKVTSVDESDQIAQEDIDEDLQPLPVAPVAPQPLSKQAVPIEKPTNRSFTEPETTISRPAPDSYSRQAATAATAATAAALATATSAATSATPATSARPILSNADDDPFVELNANGEPLVAPVVATQTPNMITSDDGLFTEIDLSQPQGRVVMGKNGLVELVRPASSIASSVKGSRVVSGQDDPFTEMLIGSAAELATQSAAAQAATQLGSRAVASQTEGLHPTDVDPFILTEVAPNAESQQIDSDIDIERPALREDPLVISVEANTPHMVDPLRINSEDYDPIKDLMNYNRPPVNLLEDYMSDSEVSDEEIFFNKTQIQETLMNFGIPIQRIKATVGPTVTLYEIVQAQGVKISKIQGLENDIAQSLKALGIRIIAPIPGKGTIGIEVPNRDKQVVSMYSSIRSQRFQESKAELPVVLGRTIQNESYVFDLTKMPHLLVAGATGQGKSVGLNAIITSLLYRKHPSQLKFVMIDPKMVEFSLYARLERHFLAKMESEDEAIITDPKKAVYTLNALCIEMDARLELCKKAGTRNISEYNAKFTTRHLNPQNGHRYLPYIVVIVDEFADLIMTAREVEAPVMRLAQKARAVGIHLIIATQRPDVKVITGGIKANFPARIAFRVMQMIDSRTIIDQPGANQLIGRGDMLLSKDGELTRMQCALVETNEVERVVDYISHQQGYAQAYLLPDYTPDSGSDSSSGMGSEESAPMKYDALFAEIAREAVASGSISTSMIQRNYEVGFNRAGRIMLQLERAGVVGRQHGVKPRDILFYDLASLEAKLQDIGL